MTSPTDYTEVLRYFEPKLHGLVVIAKEGLVLLKQADRDWRVYRRKKPDAPYDEWLASKKARRAELPAWAAEVAELPTHEELEEWLFDGVCPTPTGDDVEPDGAGPDGAPSWLVALGLI